MKKQFLAAGFVVFCCMLPFKAMAASFNNLYVFSDSLSDTENTLSATSGLVPPSAFGYDNGRFANGSIWVEFLAPKLGLTYDPSKNFSFAGVTTGTINTVSPQLPSLQGTAGKPGQIDIFKATNPTVDPDALYVFWLGSNDYLDVVRERDPAIPVGNLETAIRSLIDLGARQFLVTNLPDLGASPLVNARQNAQEVSQTVNAHNSLLASRLEQLQQEFSSQVNLIPLDVSGLIDNAIANPSQFGFTNITDPCLTNSPLFFPPSPDITICPNPNEYLFWDSLHPSSAAHKFVADAAFSAIRGASVPEPATNLGIIALGALGAVAIKRKQLKARSLEVSKKIFP